MQWQVGVVDTAGGVRAGAATVVSSRPVGAIAHSCSSGGGVVVGDAGDGAACGFAVDAALWRQGNEQTDKWTNAG